MKNKMKPRKVKEVEQPVGLQFESIDWTFHDTLILPTGTLISKEKSFYLFTEPLSSTKSLVDTNIYQGGCLTAPQRFYAWSLDVEILPPFQEYERDLVMSSMSYEFWYGCKIQAQGLLTSMRFNSFKQLISYDRHFRLNLVSNQDFMLRGQIKLVGYMRGKLDRAMQ